MMTVPRPSGIPVAPKKLSIATPVTIPGSKIGITTTLRMLRPKNFHRMTAQRAQRSEDRCEERRRGGDFEAVDQPGVKAFVLEAFGGTSRTSNPE